MVIVGTIIIDYPWIWWPEWIIHHSENNQTTKTSALWLQMVFENNSDDSNYAALCLFSTNNNLYGYYDRWFGWSLFKNNNVNHNQLIVVWLIVFIVNYG